MGDMSIYGAIRDTPIDKIRFAKLLKEVNPINNIFNGL